MKSELIENLQQAYTAQLGLSILLLDSKGTPTTTIVGENVNINRMIMSNEYGVLHEIRERVKQFDFIKKPINIEIKITDIISFKAIIAPILHNEKPSRYIFSGFYIEENGKIDIVRWKKNNSEFVSEEILDQIPVLKDIEVYNKLEIVEKFQNICSELMIRNEREEQEGFYLSSVHLNNEHDLLQRLVTTCSNVDFAVYAKKLSNETFVMEYNVGKSVSHLYGAQVNIQDAFLGMNLQTGTPVVLEHIDVDPRVLIFHKHNVFPKTLYIYPIQNEDVIGFLIIGSITVTKLTNEEYERVQYKAKIFETLYLKHLYQNQLDRQLMKMSSIIELSKTMSYTNNLKEILYILIDLFSTFIDSQFISATLKNKLIDYQIYSKSHSIDMIKDYTNSLYSQYFEDNQMKTSATIKVISDDCKIYEFPIVFKREVLGVISIASKEKISRELEVYFLAIVSFSALSLFPLLSIQQKSIGSKDKSEEISEEIIHDSFSSILSARELQIITLTTKGLSNQEIGDVLFISTNTVKNHLTKIYSKLNVSNRRQMLAVIYQLKLNSFKTS